MNEHTEHDQFLHTAREQVKEYLQLRYELLKLDMSEKAAKIIATMFSALILVIMAFFTMFFISFMAGFYFSRLLNDNFQGFGIIALFYLALLLIFFLLRKPIFENPLINKIIRNIFN